MLSYLPYLSQVIGLLMVLGRATALEVFNLGSAKVDAQSFGCFGLQKISPTSSFLLMYNLNN